MPVIRAAAYCRVSTDKEEQHSSIENQRLYFQRYIENKADLSLEGIYYDEGISGTSTKRREGFNRMIERAFAGEIDLIITKEVSRFARNTVDTLHYTRKLREHGVGVLFISDNINTLEPDGELRLTIMASIAQEESRKTSERVKWGQKRRMEQGVVFGRSLLGYDVREGRIYINPQGAEIVRMIFRKYTYEGKGSHTIARELDKAGILPMRGEKWNSSVIMKILRNEKYAGELCQRKTYTPDYLSHKKKLNCGETEKIYIKSHHEPIIERSLWERAQELIAVRSRKKGDKAGYSLRYSCSGKIFCGECGSVFVSRTKKNSDGSVYRAWRCSKNAKHGSGREEGCTNISVNNRVIESAVAFMLKAAGLRKEELFSMLPDERAFSRLVTETGECEGLQKNKRELQRKKQLLLEKLLEGVISNEDYILQCKAFDSRIAETEKSLERLSSEQKSHAAQYREFIEYITGYMEKGEISDEITGELLERAVVRKNRIVELKLRAMPIVKLAYKTGGKGAGYHTEFEII